MLNPVFRASSTLERGELKKQRKRCENNGSDETIESIPSHNYFRQSVQIYGAVADLSKALARDSSSAGKPAAN